MSQRRTIERQAIRLTDLVPAEDALAEGSPTLRDTDFAECAILGPVVLAPVESKFLEAGFSEPMDAVLWDLELDAVAVGALVVHNCTFTRCRFQKVGIAGPRRVTDWFRAVEDD